MLPQDWHREAERREHKLTPDDRLSLVLFNSEAEVILDNTAVTDPAAIKAAMDAMDMLTAYGRINFDTSEEAHGLQTGHSMIYIQWQKDDAGNLVKQVVWPLEGATADTLYPKP